MATFIYYFGAVSFAGALAWGCSWLIDLLEKGGKRK